MSIKQKVHHYYLGRKVVFQSWILVVFVVNGLVVILFSIQNVRGGFIVFVCTACLGHSCSVEEKLEFKRDEDVLQEVGKFCYLGDMISCYGGASEAVTAIIGSA